MNQLEKICARKRVEVLERRSKHSTADLEKLAKAQSKPRGFEGALRKQAKDGLGLIAEIKKASPSKGTIRENFYPIDHARAYELGGASCLSVLTDAYYFLGHENYLIEARASCKLPVLRKDFMVDPWQVMESRSIGADAILVIVAALEDIVMREIEEAALEQGMDVLVEVHNEVEMERATRLKSKLIGINNRDLKTFTTNLANTERLAALAPRDVLLVSESGINTHADCQRLSKADVRTFLVGESLMRQKDLKVATQRLLKG
jgi:indole-3-glycerol phosphate synthase